MFHVGMTKTLSFSLDKEDTTWDFQPTDDSNHGLCGQTCRPSLRHSVLGVTTARLPAQPWQKSCPQRWSSSSFKLAHSARLVQASKLRVHLAGRPKSPCSFSYCPFPSTNHLALCLSPLPHNWLPHQSDFPSQPHFSTDESPSMEQPLGEDNPPSVSLPFSIILRGQQSHQEAAFETDT